MTLFRSVGRCGQYLKLGQVQPLLGRLGQDFAVIGSDTRLPRGREPLPAIVGDHYRHVQLTQLIGEAQAERRRTDDQQPAIAGSRHLEQRSEEHTSELQSLMSTSYA